MKPVVFLFVILGPVLATAAPSPPLSQIPPIVPLHQELTAVDYFSDGRQTGCGLRITGEAKGNVFLNVLVSVFLKETGLTFGIFKVSAKTMDMKDGVPLQQDGRTSYSSIGKIHKAWLEAGPGKQIMGNKNNEMNHVDGYMASMGFATAMNLLVEIPKARLKVGFKRKKDDPEEIFEFNERIEPNEAGKLMACMKNLRETIEDTKSRKRS